MHAPKSIALALATGLVVAAMLPAAEADEDTRSQLDFIISGVDTKRQGKVLCALYDDEEEWLGRNPLRGDRVEVERSTTTCVFDDLSRGTYAIAAIHDENGNEDMDRNVIGLPVEGYCASRNAQEKGFGAPDWKDAAFRYNGKEGYVGAHMSY